MKTHVRNILGALTISGLIACSGGCSALRTETHAQAKQAALARWTHARGAILYSVARQQFEVGDLDKAQRTCAQAMTVDPKNPLFHELAGQIELGRDHLERAYDYLQQAVALDAHRAQSHYLLGVVLQRWQRYEAALKAYDQAYDCAPDQASGLLAASDMLVKLGRVDEAAERLQQKLSYFENNAALRVALGQVEMVRHHYEDAVRLFREAALLDPETTEPLEHLAMAECAAGHSADAVGYFTQLLKRKEYAQRTDLQMALADCYMQTDRPTEAREIYLKLTQANPQDVTAWIKLGQAAWIVGDLGRAAEAAQRVSSLDPRSSEGPMLAGLLARKAGQTDQAVKLFEQAAQLAPHSALPALMKGMTLQQAGDLTGAAKAYQQALSIAPQDPRAKQLLAGLQQADHQL